MKLNYLEKIWCSFENLEKNEVYMLLLVNTREKKIMDSVLIKTNDFEEFKHKVNVYADKMKRVIDAEPAIFFEVNKKDLKRGLEKACRELEYMIRSDEDLKYYTLMIQREIRCTNVTNNSVIEFSSLTEVDTDDFFLIVRKGDVYLGVTNKDKYKSLFKTWKSLPLDVDEIVKWTEKRVVV